MKQHKKRLEKLEQPTEEFKITVEIVEDMTPEEAAERRRRGVIVVTLEDTRE